MQISNANYSRKTKIEKHSNNIAFQSCMTNSMKSFGKKTLEKTLALLSGVGIASVLMSNDNKNDELNDFLNHFYPNISKEEKLLVKNAAKKDLELTKFLLSAKSANGLALRFSPSIFLEKEVFETDSNLVRTIVERKTPDDRYCFESQDEVVKLLKLYKSNPKRTIELLEEKHSKPYDDLYVNSNIDFIEGILKAEEFDKELALKFENIKLPNGVKRLNGEQVLNLVQMYNSNQAEIDNILSACWEDGTPMFNYIPTNKNGLLDLINVMKKCPNIEEFIKELPAQFYMFDLEIKSFANAYEKNPEYTLELFRMKSKDGNLLYAPTDIEDIVEAHSMNNKLTKELLGLKNNNDKLLLNGNNIWLYVKLNQTYPELFKLLFESKDSQGNIRVLSEHFIEKSIDLIKNNTKIFNEYLDKRDNDGRFAYRLDEIVELLDLYNYEDKKFIDELLNLKNVNGEKKLNIHSVKSFVNILKKHPKYKDELMKLISKPPITFEVIFDLSDVIEKNEASFKEAYEKMEKISNYFEKHGISPNYFSCIDINEEISVNLDANANRIIQFDKNGDIKSEKELNFVEQTLFENRLVSYKDGLSANSMEFLNYYEKNDFGPYPMEFVKNVYGPDNKEIYSVYTEKSKDFPNKLNLQVLRDGQIKTLAETKKDSNGDLVSIKNIGYKDSKFIQNYRENSNSRANSIKIVDKEGKIYLDSNIQFRKLSDNKYESIENGKKYSMEYFPNKVVVTKEGEAPIEITIGDNDVNAEGVLSKDLLSLIKKLPGSTLYNIHKYGILKIWQNENKINENNAQFNGIVNKIELSKFQSSDEKVFVLLHEIGHSIDFHKLRTNKELVEIFKKEKKQIEKNLPDLERAALSYLIDSHSMKQGGISCELIAEAYAILHSLNHSPEIELRGLLLTQYFPRTFTKVAELLLE